MRDHAASECGPHGGVRVLILAAFPNRPVWADLAHPAGRRHYKRRRGVRPPAHNNRRMVHQYRVDETRRAGSEGYAALAHAILYDRFVDARRRAVELTDRYNAMPLSDPARAEAWGQVVLHTEAARQLLESWLRAGSAERSSLPTDRVALEIA